MSPHPARDTVNVSLLPPSGRRSISEESCPASRGWLIPPDTKLFEFLALRKTLPKWFPVTLLLQPDVCPHVIAGRCLHQGALLMDLPITSAICWLMCGSPAASIDWVCQGREAVLPCLQDLLEGDIHPSLRLLSPRASCCPTRLHPLDSTPRPSSTLPPALVMK